MDNRAEGRHEQDFLPRYAEVNYMPRSGKFHPPSQQSPLPDQRINHRLRLTWRKKVLFSLFVTGAFFLLIEVTLALLGVRPAFYDHDPFVGFAETVPLFDGGSSTDVYFETSRAKLDFFNAQRFSKVKPKDGYRVFCVGGSTTYGRPYDDETSFCGWLRTLLPLADKTRNWEVVNAGGISYASYRVSKLMEELATYEPDLFVVYCGHNEFLEERTYGDVARTPAGILRLAGSLSHTRTYSFIAKLARGSDRPKSAQEMLPAEVDAILDRTQGPQTYRRDDDMRAKTLAHFDYNLRRLADIAASSGASVIFVTPASNLRDFSPFKSQHRADLSRDEHRDWIVQYERARKALDRGDYAESLDASDAAAGIDDRYADLHFYRGCALWKLQQFESATEAFRRARDEDVCPLRAVSPISSLVRSAASAKDAMLVDFEALIGERAEHGVPGEDWFLDHVHPTIEGNRQLALAILDALVSQKIVTTDTSWNQSVLESNTAVKLGSLDRRAHGNATRNLAKVLRWAGKFDEANRLARQAAEDLSDDAHAHMMAGDALLGQGSFHEAIGCYEQSLRLAPDYANAYLGKGLALSKLGQLGEAIVSLERCIRLQPENYHAHYRLGNVLCDLERWEEAEREYQSAIRLYPDFAIVFKRLALLSARTDDFERAIGHLEAAAAIEPHNAIYRNDLALILLDSGNLAAAEAQCREALRLDPNLPRARLAEALILDGQGARDVAAVKFQQMIDDGIEAESAHFRLAIILLRRNQGSEAAQHLRETIRLEPSHHAAADLLRRIEELSR